MARTRDAEPVTPEREAELAAVRAAVASRIGPELAAARLVPLLTVPVDLALPMLRRVRGRSGVALGPALLTQVNVVAAAGAVHLVRRLPSSRAHVWAAVGGAGWCAVSPLLAARSERFVVLRGRSPLWGYAVEGLVNLPLGVAGVTALLVTMRSARDEHRRGLLRPPP